MPTVDLGAPPPVTGGAGVRPHRLSLTLPELVWAAERAGIALPFTAPPAPAALADLDPEESLARRGLLTESVDDELAGGRLDDNLASALRTLAAPHVALDLSLDLGAADGSRTAHLRVWHRQRHGAVGSLATADGVVFALALFARTQWTGELARVAILPPGLPADWRGRLQALVTDARGESPRPVGDLTWTLEAGRWLGPAQPFRVSTGSTTDTPDSPPVVEQRAAASGDETPAPEQGPTPPTTAREPDDLATALAPLIAEAGR